MKSIKDEARQCIQIYHALPALLMAQKNHKLHLEVNPQKAEHYLALAKEIKKQIGHDG